MSGILVGIGVIVNTLSDNKYIGAMLFSLALLVIVQCKLFLYTGMIGFAKKKEFFTLLSVLFCNLFGVSLLTMLIKFGNQQFAISIEEIAQKKFSQSMYQLFLYAFVCGILMFVAVKCKDRIITIFCIMTFILSGYEHCIADFPLLLVNPSKENIVKFLLIILGNSFGSILAFNLTNKKDNNKGENNYEN